MHRVRWILPAAALLLSACASPADATATAVAQTQAYKRDLSTALAGTMTAGAPTATRTPLPPTATMTPPPSPTASGSFGFSDVRIWQVNENEFAVTFTFQIQKDIKLQDLMIGAAPKSCGSSGRNSVQFNPIELKDSPSGIVTEDDPIRVRLYEPGTCTVERVTIYVFRNNGPRIFESTFDAAVTLELE